MCTSVRVQYYLMFRFSPESTNPKGATAFLAELFPKQCAFAIVRAVNEIWLLRRLEPFGTKSLAVADLGFPRGGGANPQGGGANLLFGQKFPENCMKMNKFGPRGGGGMHPWHPPLDPPMIRCGKYFFQTLFGQYLIN